MVELCHHVDWHSCRSCAAFRTKTVGHPRGVCGRHPRAESEHEISPGGTDGSDHLCEVGIGERQRIASGEKHLPHFPMVRDIGTNLGSFACQDMGTGPCGETAAKTMPAIGRAPIGHEKGDPIAIPVDEPRQHRMRDLRQRIGALALHRTVLTDRGNDLTADRIVRIVGIDQGKVVTADEQGQRRSCVLEPSALAGSQHQVALKLLARGDGCTGIHDVYVACIAATGPACTILLHRQANPVTLALR